MVVGRLHLFLSRFTSEGFTDADVVYVAHLTRWTLLEVSRSTSSYIVRGAGGGQDSAEWVHVYWWAVWQLCDEEISHGGLRSFWAGDLSIRHTERGRKTWRCWSSRWHWHLYAAVFCCGLACWDLPRWSTCTVAVSFYTVHFNMHCYWYRYD